MADESIIKLANSFRAELLNGERKAAARMVNVYGGIYLKLLRQLAVISRQISDARNRGEVVNQAWLSRRKRFSDLLGQVEEEFQRFADIADSSIRNQQSRAVRAALGDSVKLMEAAAAQAGIEVSFNRLPTAAVENLVGTLGDGSPLRSLLDQLPRSG